jgi:LysM repeat protein/flagellum-specific peptidoglycan hydrolase FlgJ
MKNLKLLFILLIISLFSSCGSRKKTINATKSQDPKTKIEQKSEVHKKKYEVQNKDEIIIKSNQTTKDYVVSYADIAMKKMREHHIPASITLAQGILESGSGNSTLTKKSNNHFGIKCHKDWQGKKVYHDDDTKGECFRVYEKAEGSFEDHSQFLLTRSRYENLFKLEPGDYVGWAYGLKNAGYATDKKYPQKLIAFIEKYELYQYDEQVMGKPARLTSINKKTDPILSNDNIYIVKTGDALYGIAKQYNMKVLVLMELNGLTSNDLYVGQKLLIKKTDSSEIIKQVEIHVDSSEVIEKQELASDSIIYHTVQKGEGLYSIAKKYGKTINEIKEFNHLISDEIKEGQLLLINLNTIIPLIESQPIEINDTETNKSEEKKVETTEPDTKKIVEKINETDKTIIPTTHTVQTGETLYQIAYKYQLEVPFLRELNHLKNDQIRIGQVILLKEETINFNKTIHTVQKGDTLFSVSNKYKVSIEKIIALNNIQNNTISLGQVLKLE